MLRIILSQQKISWDKYSQGCRNVFVYLTRNAGPWLTYAGTEWTRALVSQSQKYSWKGTKLAIHSFTHPRWVTAILLFQLQWTIIGTWTWTIILTWHRCPCACTQSHNRQTGRDSYSSMCKNENCLFSFRIQMIITDHYILCVEEFWWYPRKQIVKEFW